MAPDVRHQQLQQGGGQLRCDGCRAEHRPRHDRWSSFTSQLLIGAGIDGLAGGDLGVDLVEQRFEVVVGLVGLAEQLVDLGDLVISSGDVLYSSNMVCFTKVQYMQVCNRKVFSPSY